MKKCWCQQNWSRIPRDSYTFRIFFKKGNFLPRFIIVAYVWQSLGTWGRAFSSPSFPTWAAWKGPSWIGLMQIFMFCFRILSKFNFKIAKTNITMTTARKDKKVINTVLQMGCRNFIFYIFHIFLVNIFFLIRKPYNQNSMKLPNIPIVLFSKMKLLQPSCFLNHFL